MLIEGDTLKNKWWTLLLVFMVLFALCSFPAGSADAPKTFCLTIFHANNFHGYEPANLSRQATIVYQARAENPNVLFLNAGDLFTRGKYHQVFYGELEFAQLNAMGLDFIGVAKILNHA